MPTIGNRSHARSLPRTPPIQQPVFLTMPSLDLETGLSDTALAQELANPIANLTSVPFQNNFDFGGGRGNAFRYTLNVQPVIPFTLNDDWNLITRTIIPFAHVERVFPQPETVSATSSRVSFSHRHDL